MSSFYDPYSADEYMTSDSDSEEDGYGGGGFYWKMRDALRPLGNTFQEFINLMEGVSSAPLSSETDGQQHEIHLSEPSIHKCAQSKVAGSSTGSVWEGRADSNQPAALLDIAAREIGRNFSCQDLESHQPPLDEALLKKVAFWAFPWNLSKLKTQLFLSRNQKAWILGQALVSEKQITMSQVGFMATAVVSSIPSRPSSETSTSTAQVSLSFEKQTLLRGSCSECREEIWCPHIIAAIYHRVQNLDRVTVHAPVTEILSTLDRNQLQKLVQYTINDDPKMVLGNVFQHIGELRDINSEMNQLGGAPDPTFSSLPDGSHNQWDLTLERVDLTLDKMFEKCQRSFGHIANGMYPDGYDVNHKHLSNLQAYIKQLLPIIQQGHYQEAVDILHVLTRCSINRSIDLSGMCCPRVQMFLHDLDRFYASLIIYLADKDSKVHARIGRDIAEAQKQFKAMHPGKKPLRHSKIAEMPALHNAFTVDIGDHHFPQSLAAFQVPQASHDFKDLSSGNAAPSTSQYNEALEVMLIRMEAILLFEASESITKFSRVAERVLQLLVSHLIKMSVMKEYLPELATDALSPFECWQLLSLPNVPESVCLGASGAHKFNRKQDDTLQSCKKGKATKRKASDKGKQPAKKKKSNMKAPNPSPAVSMGHAELTYSLMYTLKLFIEKSTKPLHSTFITSACLLATESLHYVLQPCDNNIFVTELSWVQKLIMSIWDLFQSSLSTADSVGSCWFFLEAAYHHGNKVYGSNYPLLMMQKLCHLCRQPVITDQQTNMLVCVCFKVVQGILQQEGGQSVVLDEHLSSVRHGLLKVSDCLFSLLNTNSSDHVDMAVQVIQTLKESLHPSWMDIFNKVLRSQILRLESQPELQRSIFGLCLHNILSNTHYLGVMYSQEIFLRLASMIGIKCLNYEGGEWAEKLTAGQLCSLLQSLEPEFKKEPGQELPKEVYGIIKSFFTVKRDHSEGNIKEMLGHLPKGGWQWEEVCGVIMARETGSFYPNNLLQIALWQLEPQVDPLLKKGSRKRKPTLKKALNEVVTPARNPCHTEEGLRVMNDKAMSTVLKAFASVKPASGGSISVPDITEITRACVNVGKTNTRDCYLKQLIDGLKEEANSCPDLYSTILKTLTEVEQPSPKLKDKSLDAMKEGLATSLLESQVNHVREHLVQARCITSSYRAVIRLMNSCRIQCMKLVPNGEKRFVDTVVPTVLKEFKNKKKFCRMAREEFL